MVVNILFNQSLLAQKTNYKHVVTTVALEYGPFNM